MYCIYYSGAKEFGAVGTCWGSYMVLKECAYPEVKKVFSLLLHFLKSVLSSVQGGRLVAPQPLPHLRPGGGGGEGGAGPGHLPPAVHAGGRGSRQHIPRGSGGTGRDAIFCSHVLDTRTLSEPALNAKY